MPNGNDIDVGTQSATPRGYMREDVAAQIRETRVAEQWERYDSIVIGPGANALDAGWFNTWADLANADELVWFSRRSSAVGTSFTNQQTERTDWAQDIYQTGIEFLAPPGLGDRESEVVDEQIMPLLFTKILPGQMSFRVRLADADDISIAPGSHYPAGYGDVGAVSDGAAAPFLSPGVNGTPHTSNTWKWPEPVMLPAQGKITAIARIDNPIRQALRGLTTSPGVKLLPPPGGVGPAVQLPNFYVIKVFMRGPRYLQLRGARSAA